MTVHNWPTGAVGLGEQLREVQCRMPDGTRKVLQQDEEHWRNALDYLEIGLKNGCPQDKLKLVHGIVRPKPEHTRAYAWVEQTDGERSVCVQAAQLDGRRIFFAVYTEEFLSIWRPIDATEYSVRQAAAMMLVKGHAGPWLLRYRLVLSLQRHYRAVSK